MKVVISIPVHEKPEVILNQIKNIKRFNEEAEIVIHISAAFYEKYSDEKLINNKKIHINPKHLETSWGNIIFAHLSNFEYMKSMGKFDYFVMHSSNDMYIKSGFLDYIYKFDCGFYVHPLVSDKSFWWPTEYALKDKQLKSILKELNADMAISSQVEGSFYRCELMDEIDTLIKKTMEQYNDRLNYPREEVYFPTIAYYKMNLKLKGNITTFSEVHVYDSMLWMPWMLKKKIKLKNTFSKKVVNFILEKLYEINYKILKKTLIYRLSVHQINMILKKENKFINKYKYLCDGVSKYPLYGGKIFSVKRVNRDIDDKIRKYISKL